MEKPEINLEGGGFNALLWCEMVAGNPAPPTRQLPWSGNFVIPATTNDPKSAIDGTFALSFKLFLETHLLPRLQIFNQACEVSDLHQTYDMRGNLYWTSWNYAIGNYGKRSDDAYFKFERIEQSSNDTTPAIRYEFKQVANADDMHVWSGGHAARLFHNCE